MGPTQAPNLRELCDLLLRQSAIQCRFLRYIVWCFARFVILTMAIYLDDNATTSPHLEAISAMQAAMMEAWGNPSSIHGAGREARRRVERARAQVAELMGCGIEDVVFTSGATEALHLSLHKLCSDSPEAWVVSSKLEHPAVRIALEKMSCENRIRVAWLPVDGHGVAQISEAPRLTGGEKIHAFCMQQVNSETGVIQPMAEVFSLARSHGASVVVDTAQAVGRLPTLWPEADARVVAAHKIGGPKGIGALITRPGFRPHAVFGGGQQERGVRPGTSDAALSAGFGAAASLALTGAQRYAALAPLRDAFEARIVDQVRGAWVVGQGASRAPHVTNILFPNWNAPELVAALDLEGVYVSAGSACSAGTVDVSTAIAAIVGVYKARGAVRFSMGPSTQVSDLERAAEIIVRVLSR